MGRKILLCFFTILLLTLGRAGPVAAVTVEVKRGEPAGTLLLVLEEA